ncbi:MAG: hypothetical protein K2X81_27980 [Candidatus Obscuribacterales bacterium]|nr:hypothetical protein [Candidatus Obscuribacterales bacterium]
MKTKTSSIFITLLLVVLGFCTGSSPCVCPAEISQRISTTVSTIVELVSSTRTIDGGDICCDCGHTKNCCYSHKELPAIASAASISVVDCIYLSTLWSPVSILSVHFLSKESIGAVGNRAPPWIVKATLQNLHQKLLV